MRSFERQSMLGKLELLDLSYNSFNGIIPSLGFLSSLKTLNLQGINLNGSIDIGGLKSLSKLKMLNLRWNEMKGLVTSNGLNGSLPNQDKINLGKFPDSIYIPPSLEALGISNNHMSGNLPRWMGNMSNLMGIAMFSNHFEGPIPVEFCKLGNLKFLDLSKNNLSGSIPSCFNQLRVKHVHLNRNQLSGLMTNNP
ncbi:unnamed protein product [Camellia sinensis]